MALNPLRGALGPIGVRAADLRFTHVEAAEFLNRGMGLNLSAQNVAALETRTELLQGEMPQALTTYLAELETPLLVLGSSHLESAASLLTAIRAQDAQVPVLVVYRESGS